MSEIAKELGCDGHTVNETLLADGEALRDNEHRIGVVEALGLDEALFDGSSDSGEVNFIAPESDEPNKEPLIRTSVGRRGLDPRTLGLKVPCSSR